jgi:hypothetical protein
MAGTCRACGEPLDREYYLPFHTPCLPTDGDEVPGMHRVRRRYQAFKVIAPILGLGAYGLVWTQGLRDPIQLVLLVVGWAHGSAFLALVVDQLRGRPRL